MFDPNWLVICNRIWRCLEDIPLFWLVNHVKPCNNGLVGKKTGEISRKPVFFLHVFATIGVPYRVSLKPMQWLLAARPDRAGPSRRHDLETPSECHARGLQRTKRCCFAVECSLGDLTRHGVFQWFSQHKSLKIYFDVKKNKGDFIWGISTKNHMISCI